MRNEESTTTDTPACQGSRPASKPDPKSLRRRRIKDALLCVSLANLCFIQAWSGVFYEGDHGFFKKTPVTATTLAALLLNIGGAALLFWLGAQWARRPKERAIRFVANTVLCLLLLVPLNYVRITYLELQGTAVLVWAKKSGALFLGFVLAASFVCWHRFWGRFARVLLMIFLPLVAISLGQIGLAWFRLATPVAARPAPVRQFQAAPDQPRVVWIIFDEMDRRLTFDQRPPGVELPELDQLRRESLDATNGFSPAGVTFMALPSLLSGRTAVSVEPGSASDLNIVWQDTRERGTWAASSNVFSRARALGLNTAIVGWYLPYSRMLETSANRIDWMPLPWTEPARGSGLARTMRNQVCSMLPFLHSRLLTFERIPSLLAGAREIAADPNTHLAFLHLPLPHRPAIYRAKTGEFTAFNFSMPAGYFDNLALCDRVLGELRRGITQAGLGDRTWLLVSSDHWWRESHCADGKTDHRVPFLLKAPRDNRPVTFGRRFSTVVSQALLLAILRGEVRGHEDAAAWLEEHQVPPPNGYGRFGEAL
jgi:hypothetical protein